MKSRRPVLRIVAVVLIIGLMIWIAHSCFDAPAPDDADLRVAYDTIPADENAFTYFNRAGAELQWPEETAQKDLLADMAAGKAWDDAAANEILAQNEGVLAFIEQGLACPRCQLPETAGYGDRLPYLAPWRTIARLAAIRAERLLRNGHDEDGFEQAMLIVRFGHRIQNGRASLIAYLVGLSIEEIGLRQTTRMLAKTTLDPDRLAEYIRRLAECRASGEGLADGLRSEYACACRLVNDMVAGGRPVKSRGVDRLSGLRLFFFKPNKTRRALARTTRVLIANASTTHDEATPFDLSKGNKTLWTIRAAASGNFVGAVIYRMLMPSLDRAAEHKCRLNSSVAMTQVLIALRCYQLEHGELPDTLAEMVPEYLDAVPLDDFDGKPIRYSKAKRVIYSIGRDLVDAGGADETDPHMDEPTVKIGFETGAPSP